MPKNTPLEYTYFPSVAVRKKAVSTKPVSTKVVPSREEVEELIQTKSAADYYQATPKLVNPVTPLRPKVKNRKTV